MFYPKPTPGKANDTQSFDSIDSARYPKNKEAVISEVAAVNRTGVKAANGQYYDYIELHNPTDKPVSLNGYRLSKKEDPAAYKTLPNVQLAPGEYKLVFCGDTDSYNTRTKEIFIAMGLGRYGSISISSRRTAGWWTMCSPAAWTTPSPAAGCRTPTRRCTISISPPPARPTPPSA